MTHVLEMGVFVFLVHSSTTSSIFSLIRGGSRNVRVDLFCLGIGCMRPMYSAPSLKTSACRVDLCLTAVSAPCTIGGQHSDGRDGVEWRAQQQGESAEYLHTKGKHP